MVSTNLHNRSEIKSALGILFSHIQNSDWGEAKNASEYLRDSLLKYYKSRGISANHYYDLFSELDYSILYATDNNFKKMIVLDKLEVIIKEIKTSTKEPLARLKEIYEDIRHLLGDINRKNAVEIIDCFDEISELKPEIEAIGGATYNYYTLMRLKIGDCESTIRRVTQNPSESLFSTIDTKFSALFQAINKVLAPPIRIEMDRREVYDKVRAGVPIEEVSEATGQSEEDLRMLLSREEAERSAEEMNLSE